MHVVLETGDFKIGCKTVIIKLTADFLFHIVIVDTFCSRKVK